ncbi:MAG: PEP-CTERM sorting domain-containing protein [Cyanobacteria bacterium J06648_16]
MTKLSKLLTLSAASSLMTLATAAPSQAVSLNYVLNPFTGSDAQVNITLTESGDDIDVTVDVDTSVAMADLRGVFFNVSNEAILPFLQIVDTVALEGSGRFYGDDYIKTQTIGANSVTGGIGGANFSGEPDSNPCADGCDGAIEVGSNGIGKDDYQSIAWKFTRSDGAALTLEDFENAAWGARLMSVGTDGNREGSSKLGGTVVAQIVEEFEPDPAQTPEPGSLLALGLISGGVAFSTKRRRQAAPAS